MSEYKKEEWRVKQPAADIRALAEQFSISPILAHIIVNREITEPDAVACYLSDDLVLSMKSSATAFNTSSPASCP